MGSYEMSSFFTPDDTTQTNASTISDLAMVTTAGMFGTTETDRFANIITTATSDLYITSTIDHNHDNNAHYVNMTKQEIQEYLEKLENGEILLYIPAIIFLVIVAVVGFFGNILVLMVYNSKKKKNPTSILIMALAAFDLFSNVLCIPGDVNETLKSWTFTNSIQCRFFTYATLSTTIISAYFLLALAVVRYRKICRPFGRTLTISQAKILSVSIAIFGWVVSIPYGIINGTRTRPTPRSGIVGHDCSIDDDYVDTKWPMVNGAFIFFLYLAGFVSLVVLYTFIGIQAHRHKKFNRQSTVNKGPSSTVANSMTLSSTEVTLDNIDEGGLSSTVALTKDVKNPEEAMICHILDSKMQDVSKLEENHVLGDSEKGEITVVEETIKTYNDTTAIKLDIDKDADRNYMKMSEDENVISAKSDSKTLLYNTNAVVSFLESSVETKNYLEDNGGGEEGKEIAGASDITSDSIESDEDAINESRVLAENAGNFNKGTSITFRKNLKKNPHGLADKCLRKKDNASKNNHRGNIINKTTLMLIAITSVFGLSYVPYFIFDFYRLSQPTRFKAMGPTELILYRLLRRLPYINTAVNAIIYSICNEIFRRDAVAMFHRIRQGCPCLNVASYAL